MSKIFCPHCQLRPPSSPSPPFFLHCAYSASTGEILSTKRATNGSGSQATARQRVLGAAPRRPAAKPPWSKS
ncbi:MAG: hypothetical protein Q4G69_13815 [Planctomycetia bacterium]|nr:hypothetical protein [Planctomycetia bacterium]